MLRFHSGAAIDRLEITHLILPPIREVVWEQPQETHVTNVLETLTNKTHKNTHMPESKQRNDVESQTSPMKETSPQVSGSSTKPLLGDQTENTSVQCPNDSKKQQQEIQRIESDITTHDNGDDNISPPSSSLAKFQQFYSECFFHFFLFIPSWLQGPSSIVAFKGRVFHGVFWSRLEKYFIFFV